MQKTVARLLEVKGDHVWSINPDATVFEGIELLAEKGIGALLVSKASTWPGSSRSAITPARSCSRAANRALTPIRDIMTAELHTVTLETTTSECMELMTNERIRHLPVLEDGRVVGLISIGDVVRSVIEEQQFLIDQLESYITG